MESRELNSMLLQCCFCGEIICAGLMNPCTLSIATNIDKSEDMQNNQLFFCHVECFTDALHEDVRQLFALQDHASLFE